MSLPGEHGPLICQGGHCKVYHSKWARGLSVPHGIFVSGPLRLCGLSRRNHGALNSSWRARQPEFFIRRLPHEDGCRPRSCGPDMPGLALMTGMAFTSAMALVVQINNVCNQFLPCCVFCKEIFFTNYTVVMLTPVCKGVCGDLPAPEQKADLLTPVFPERSAAVSCMQDCSAARWSGLQKERGRCPA